MAQFKRLKLFVNLSQMDQNNMIYDEVWIYKLKSSKDDEAKIGRYRIRYQKSDNPLMFAGEDESVAPEDYADIESAFSQFGPATLCYLEVWTDRGWKRCLDWIGEPGSHHINACMDLNDQYQAFLTGMPILDPFISSGPGSKGPGPKKPKRKKDSDSIFPDPKPDVDPNEFDWI